MRRFLANAQHGIDPMALKTPKREDVDVHAKIHVHQGKLSVLDIRFDAPRFSGDKMEGVSREIVQREDAAAALVHDIERDMIILCEQFRAPAFLADGGWLVELPAGKLDRDETPEACIKRELEEELGCRAETFDPIASYFSAPGYSTERIHLFYTPITTAALDDAEAHGHDPGEDVRRIEQSRKAFLERLELGSFEDGKILAASAWAITRLGDP